MTFPEEHGTTKADGLTKVEHEDTDPNSGTSEDADDSKGTVGMETAAKQGEASIEAVESKEMTMAQRVGESSCTSADGDEVESVDTGIHGAGDGPAIGKEDEDLGNKSKLLQGCTKIVLSDSVLGADFD